MKKCIVCFFVLILMLSILTIATADEQVNSCGDYDYTVKEDGTAVIVKYHGDDTSDISIPGTLDGYTVTTIGAEAFKGAYSSYSADRDMTSSISITLPESIIAIEDKAFWGRCIRSINIPDAVAHIGYGAFVFTSTSVEFRISNNHPCYAIIDGSLYGKANKELLHPYTPDNAAKRKVTIPEGILSVGDYSFYGYFSRINGNGTLYVSLPSTLINIGEYAFYNTELSIPNMTISVKEIGQYAFASTEFSSELQICAEIIGDYAFFGSYMDSTKGSFKLMDGVVEIGDYSFSQTANDTKSGLSDRPKRTSIIIPESVEKIGIGCFKDSAMDIRFSQKSNLTEIPEYAFEGCGVGTEFLGVDENGVYNIVGSSSDGAYSGVWLPSQSRITCIRQYAFKDANVFNGYGVLGNVSTLESNSFFHASFCKTTQQRRANSSYYDTLKKYSFDVVISPTCKTIYEGTFYTLAGYPLLSDGIEIIESAAFRHDVEDYYLPATLTLIAVDAFGKDSTFIVEAGSYAERWAKENAYPYTVNGEEQNLDWLNN